MWNTLTSLAIWGPEGGGGGREGSFNNQTGPSWFTSILSFIIIYMSNIEAISWYDKKKLLIFKIKINQIIFFFSGSCWVLTSNPGVPGPPKCHQMQPSSQWRHMYNKGNNLKTSFSYMSQNVKKMYILGYVGGPEGVFNDQTELTLLSSYHLTHIHVHVK